MKKALQSFIVVFSFCLLSVSLMGQSDTLLFQNFQEDIGDQLSEFPDEDNPQFWTTWDEDAIPDANNRPGGWYWALEFEAPDTIAAADSNFVFTSSSWLAGYDPGSTNWFITPEILITDDQATFHWKSAPFQGPRYMDGYAIKVLVGNPFYAAADQVDEVYTAGEMTDWIGDNQSLDPDTFLFSSGYIHAETYTDSTYFIAPGLDADGIPLSTSNDGVLEPHSISLADYAGQSVFIAVHHNSSDDNLIEIDDLLVLGNMEPNNTNDELISQFRYVTYPNPVDNYLNVMFRLKAAADVQLSLFNMEGKLLQVAPNMSDQIGEIQHRFNMMRLPAGNYNVVLEVDGQRITRQVSKR